MRQIWYFTAEYKFYLLVTHLYWLVIDFITVYNVFLGILPPRKEVKELNHPIDPPPTYFSNFGENLKHDKFDGENNYKEIA